jgi:hypothetical protein
MCCRLLRLVDVANAIPAGEGMVGKAFKEPSNLAPTRWCWRLVVKVAGGDEGRL